MLFAQNAECAICRRGLPELDNGLKVDHNHVTGAVRMLLCHECNTALGLSKENVVTLSRMIEYLTIWKDAE